MNCTTIHITRIGYDTKAKTLQLLGKMLFLATEVVEETLIEQKFMQDDDRLIWNIKIEGPDWDYIAEGEIIRMRGDKQIGSHKIIFSPGKISLGTRGETLTGVALIKLLVSHLEAQEVGIF